MSMRGNPATQIIIWGWFAGLKDFLLPVIQMCISQVVCNLHAQLGMFPDTHFIRMRIQQVQHFIIQHLEIHNIITIPRIKSKFMQVQTVAQITTYSISAIKILQINITFFFFKENRKLINDYTALYLHYCCCCHKALLPNVFIKASRISVFLFYVINGNFYYNFTLINT